MSIQYFQIYGNRSINVITKTFPQNTNQHDHKKSNISKQNKALLPYEKGSLYIGGEFLYISEVPISVIQIYVRG